MKTVFVSSTVSDLREERALIKRLLDDWPDPHVRCLLSEAPDFPIEPWRGQRDAYEIALARVREADFVVQVINRRYGVADIDDDCEQISITHAEYREAWRRRLPMLTLARRELWDAYQQWSRGESQVWVPEDQLPVFGLLSEVLGDKRRTWIARFESLSELETQLRSNLLTYDDSEFVDESPPDGATVLVDTTFTKTWRIRNIGWVRWEGRSLQEIDASLLRPSATRVAIPTTKPGEIVRISVDFTAPAYPGQQYSRWKIYGPDGRESFDHRKGVWALVNVRER